MLERGVNLVEREPEQPAPTEAELEAALRGPGGSHLLQVLTRRAQLIRYELEKFERFTAWQISLHQQLDEILGSIDPDRPLLPYGATHELAVEGLARIAALAQSLAEEIAVQAIKDEKSSRKKMAQILGVHQVTIARWVDHGFPPNHKTLDEIMPNHRNISTEWKPQDPTQESSNHPPKSGNA